jgi:O-antigen ligase
MGILIRVLVVAYVGAVVLLSFREGLTVFARILGAVLAIACVVMVAGGRRRLTVPDCYKLWVVWVLFAGVSAVQAISPALAAFKLLTVVQVLCIGFVLTNVLIWHGSTLFYRVAIVAATLASSAIVMVDPARFSDLDGRVVGTLGNANAYGFLLVVSLIISAVAVVDREARVPRILAIAAAGALFLMIIRTGSRQALLGAAIGCMSVLVVYLVRARRRGLLPVLYGAVATAVVLVVGSQLITESDFWPRIEAAIEAARSGDLGSADDTSLQGRLWLYATAWAVALDHPILGIGLDNFRLVQGSVIGTQVGTYSHTNYMEILASTGFPGFILYFSAYAVLVRKIYRLRGIAESPRAFGSYAVAAAIATSVIVMDVATVSYYNKILWLAFPLVLAEIVKIERQPRRRVMVSPGRASLS